MENMSILDNRYIKAVFVMIAAIVLNVVVIACTDFKIKDSVSLQYTVKADQIDTYQTFYSNGENWDEQKSISIDYAVPGVEQELAYGLPKDTTVVRLDLGNQSGQILLSNISISYLWNKIDIDNKVLTQPQEQANISNITDQGDAISIVTTGNDPYISMDLTTLDLESLFKVDIYMNILFKVLGCIGVNVLLVIFIKKRRIIKDIAREICRNRELIWSLSKNDFKTKYAGSYLGIIWAFIQPIVTVLVYWFVFQVGFRSGSVGDFPFVLWLVAGIVPWFFFSEALMNATNSMLEYSYLVKKVVFKISILPIVKITSALFVHIFFVCFTILLFGLYGYMPNVYMLQVIYYSFCMFILVLGISYATSAIVIFFKDLGQIINIFLQVGMWMTPIMWNYDMISEQYRWILKINPMYYIVEGYRDSLINHVWFWHRFNQTIYFWILTIGLFGIGTIIFKKLKVHFADVL